MFPTITNDQLSITSHHDMIRIQMNKQSRPGKAIQVLETDPCFVFHHANAFEQGDEIIVDSVCYEDFVGLDHKRSYPDNTDFEKLPPGQLWRFHLNLGKKKGRRQLISPRCVEFPQVSPERIGQAHHWIFLGAAEQAEGNAPLQAIMKINPESGQQEFWSAAPRGFVGEPVFVPRSKLAEDDGWVITLVYDAAYNRTDIVILDGKCLSQGPVARLHLKHHVSYGLHGTFTSAI
jgi:all-trans-8'-apo-beta-carotenal 15,15'-oxygenase